MEMNFDALTFLFEGNADHAVKLIQQCISLIQSALAHFDTPSMLPSQALPVALSAIEITTDVLDEPDVERLSHDGFLFYRHAFTLEFDEMASVPDTNGIQIIVPQDWDLSSLGALLLYNLGLIHHERGINARIPLAIRRAQSLYRSALTLLCSRRRDEGSSYQAQAHLTMALYNNLGHAATFFQDPTAEVCHQRLGEILVQPRVRWGLETLQNQPNAKNIVSPSWFDFFYESWNHVFVPVEEEAVDDVETRKESQ